MAEVVSQHRPAAAITFPRTARGARPKARDHFVGRLLGAALCPRLGRKVLHTLPSGYCRAEERTSSGCASRRGWN